MAMRFQTLATPNPNERGFRVYVDDALLKPETFPTKGTTYEAWSLVVKERMQVGWEGYIYLTSENVNEAGQACFIFGKNHTQEERLTPFNSYTIWERYTWPAVVLSFGILLDSTVPIQYFTNLNASQMAQQPRPFVRVNYQPSAEVDSEVLVEEFLSSTPFTAAELSHRQPVPSEFSWDILGSRGSYEKCLHPTIEFMEMQPEAYASNQLGTKDADRVFGSARKQVFPATNFTTWIPFVLSDTQREVNGQYHRIRKTIRPPAETAAVMHIR